MNSSKDLDNLVDDIYDSLASLSQGKELEISKDLVEDFGERMKGVLLHWTQPHKQSKGLRMSNIGRPAKSRQEECACLLPSNLCLDLTQCHNRL